MCCKIQLFAGLIGYMDVIHLFDVVILSATIWVSAVYRLNAWLWTALFLAALIGISFFGHISVTILLILWVSTFILLALVHLKNYRIRYLLPQLLQRLKKQMPAIGKTEKEAIEAGDVWWEKELFCG